MRNNKGSVLIYVLIVISFSVAIAFLINENATSNYEATYDLYFHNQAYIYATSSLDIIKSFFEIDDDSYDSQLDIWNNIPPIKIENSVINFIITPANIKINLNLLAEEGDTNTSVRIFDALETIFQDENINNLTPGIIKDWIDEDNEPADDGREEYTYDDYDFIYKIKNKPLDTIMELSFIDNYNSYYKLKDYFTVIDEDKKLNINFCSDKVLKAYLPELTSYAKDLVDYRRNNEYKNISDIRDATYISDDEYIEAVNYLTVNSNYYYIKIIVKLIDTNYTYHILYNRKSKKIEKFIQGFDNDYF
jgi:type II secretory pathway component PulK